MASPGARPPPGGGHPSPARRLLPGGRRHRCPPGGQDDAGAGDLRRSPLRLARGAGRAHPRHRGPQGLSRPLPRRRRSRRGAAGAGPLLGPADAAGRGRPERLFILTGSQQFHLLQSATQSLAGRVSPVPLAPFTPGELESVGAAPARLGGLVFRGLCPPIYDRDLAPGIWYGDYVRTYLERDVRQRVDVRDLARFQLFLRMAAARCAQLLNLSAPAADRGIPHNTARGAVRSRGELPRSPPPVAPPQPLEAPGQDAEAPLRRPGPRRLAGGDREPGAGRRARAARISLRELGGRRGAQGAVPSGPLIQPLLLARPQRPRGGPDDRAGRGARAGRGQVGTEVAGDFCAGLLRFRAIADAGADGGRRVYGGGRDGRRCGIEIVRWRELGRPPQP